MRGSLAVQYHSTDGSKFLVAQLPVSVADAERGLRASATKGRYDSPYAVGNVLVPERGQFSLKDQTAIRERAATRRGGNVGASPDDEPIQRPLEPGERQYGLEPYTHTNTDVATLAHWQTSAYTVNGKPAAISSNFVLSLRPIGPSKMELRVHQPRVRVYIGRRITMNVHTLAPYVDCRERPDDRPVPEDLEVVMQWARDAIYAAPPIGAK